MTASAQRYNAPSGNPDHAYFSAVCRECEWGGAFHSNRTIEGRSLAVRDADEHNRAKHGKAPQMSKVHRNAPGLYQTVDVVDGDGRPFCIIRRDDLRADRGILPVWLVLDSRNREVSRHDTLTDARNSLG